MVVFIERWPFLRGEVIVVSIWTQVLGRFVACGYSLEVVVNGGSIVYTHQLQLRIVTYNLENLAVFGRCFTIQKFTK